MIFQELESMTLLDLRAMAKDLGVDSPTTYPKRELVLKIMEKKGILVNENELPAPPKRRGGRQKKTTDAAELFDEAPGKSEMITVFLALLELIRLSRAIAVQQDTYGDIEIQQINVNTTDTEGSN